MIFIIIFLKDRMTEMFKKELKICDHMKLHVKIAKGLYLYGHITFKVKLTIHTTSTLSTRMSTRDGKREGSLEADRTTSILSYSGTSIQRTPLYNGRKNWSYRCPLYGCILHKIIWIKLYVDTFSRHFYTVVQLNGIRASPTIFT